MKSVPHRLVLFASLLTLSSVVIGCLYWAVGDNGEVAETPRAASREQDKNLAVKGQQLLAPPLWDGSVSLQALPLTTEARSRALGAGWIASTRMVGADALKPGELVTFPMEAGVDLVARVEASTNDHQRLRVSGRLAQGRTGSFVMSWNSETGVEGQVLDHDRRIAYQFKQQDQRVIVAKLGLGEILCEGIPREPNSLPTRPEATRGARALMAVPALDSKPDAAGVLYLDFDGEVVTDPYWNGGVTIFAAPAMMDGDLMTAEQITDVWKRVAEDFMPFNVSVTTIRSRYDNAPVGNRMRCIQTPTSDAAPWSGGVAYLKSYRAHFYNSAFRDDIPCWSFNDNTPAIMAMTISHELGHTLNLRHDGDSLNTYYAGHGSGNLFWGPIMGAPFGARITQWSKGEYPGANNQEDDLLITKNVLEEANSSVNGYRADEAGGSIATAEELGIMSTISKHGVIHSSSDRDFYEFRTAGGMLTVTTLLANEPNLDPRISVVNSSNAVLASSAISPSSLGATLSVNLAMGTYFLVIEAGERIPVLGNPGFTKYSSIGAYQLSGTYVPLPEIPLLVTDPEPLTVVREGATVTLYGAVLSNSKVTYRWRKDGSILPGKSSPSLTFKPANYTHSGSYVLEAENDAGLVVSNPAVLEVNYKPVFNLHPTTAIQSLPAGTSTTIEVAAHGTGALIYRWQKNGIDIQGNPSAATAALELPGLDWFDSGNYTCVCTNDFGSTTSKPAKLAITSAPVFTSGPASIMPVARNSTFTLRNTTVGNATIRYQWFKGDAPIPGATKSSLTLTKASEASHEGSPYFVRATNIHGSNDSSPVTIDVQEPPAVVISGPASINSVAGASEALSVEATGTSTLTYQWYQNNQLLLGQNQPVLMFPSLHWTHRGIYKCVVTNAVGRATSKNMTVTLASPAVILSPPASIKLPTKGKGTLKVVAGGTPTLRYQWLKDGNPIPGAVKSTLVLSNASPLSEGSYQVDVLSTLDMMPERSAAAVVEVENPPVISLHPFTTYAPIGGTATLVGAATDESAPVLRYQWYKGKQLLAGETNPAITLNSLTLAAAGSYHLVISNDVGKASTKSAVLYVQTPPQVVTHPASRRHYEHDTVTFSVKATGTATLKYAWYHNDGPAIPGATSAVLTLKNVPASAEGTYYCIVSNKVGTAHSLPAILELDPVPAPTFTSFSPGLAAVGHRVRISGTNLNWTTNVKLGQTNCSFVKVNPEEVLITVPSGARTGKLTVTTYGGSFTTPDNLVITSGLTNDHFANARILVGSSTAASGSNAQASFEYDEPFFWQGKTVWYRWRCPASGSYTLNSNRMTFGHVVQIFSGSSIENLVERNLTYWYFDLDGDLYWSGPSTWNAIVQQEYFFRVDGVNYDSFSPYTGSINFTISRTASSSQAYAGVSDQPLSGQPQEASPLEFELPQGSGGSGTFQAVFDAGKDSPGFQWKALAEDGTTLFALEFDPALSAITGRDRDGKETATAQIFSGSGIYDMEVAIDPTSQTWSVLLNGQPVLAPLSWLGEGTSADLILDHLSLQALGKSPSRLPRVLSAQWMNLVAPN